MVPRISISLILSVGLLAGCQSNYPTVETIPNFAVVDPQRKIYRGGEPLTPRGWAYLKKLGVRTIVKLNAPEESLDKGAKHASLRVVPFPITQHEQTSSSPDRAKIKNAVKEMSRGAVFVHCGSDARSNPNSLAALSDSQGGQDRTSLVVGSYRVWVDHWQKARAREEMKSFHFHAVLLPGLARFWRDQVP